MMSHKNLTIWLLCLLGTITSGACLGQDVVTRQIIGWTSDASEARARALVLLEVSKTDYVQLVLLEAPGGRRLVLRDIVYGPEGIWVQRLVDDQTGWWVEVNQDIQFKARDLKDFYDRGIAHLQGRGEGRLLLTLRSSGGLAFSAEVTDSGASSALDALLRRIEESGLAAKLAEEMPADLTEPAAFMDSFGTATGDVAPGQAFAELWNFLAKVRKPIAGGGTAATASAGPWVARVEDRVAGAAPLEGAYLSLARGFRSAPAEDPLAGWHAADLRAKAPRHGAATQR